VPRTASLDATTHKPVLSPCAFPDGSSAWLQPQLGEVGATFNDTAYQAQFPLPAEQYSLQQLHSLDGDSLLQQAQLADSNTHAWGNATQSEYSKWMLQVRQGCLYCGSATVASTCTCTWELHSSCNSRCTKLLCCKKK
jgi:hypothetical protein